MVSAVMYKHGYYTDDDCKTASDDSSSECTVLKNGCTDIADISTCKYENCMATTTFEGKGAQAACELIEEGNDATCDDMSGYYSKFTFDCKSGAAALSMIGSVFVAVLALF